MNTPVTLPPNGHTSYTTSQRTHQLHYLPTDTSVTLPPNGHISYATSQRTHQLHYLRGFCNTVRRALICTVLKDISHKKWVDKCWLPQPALAYGETIRQWGRALLERHRTSSYRPPSVRIGTLSSLISWTPGLVDWQSQQTWPMLFPECGGMCVCVLCKHVCVSMLRVMRCAMRYALCKRSIGTIIHWTHVAQNLVVTRPYTHIHIHWSIDRVKYIHGQQLSETRITLHTAVLLTDSGTVHFWRYCIFTMRVGERYE